MFRAILDWLVHGDTQYRRPAEAAGGQDPDAPMGREELLKARERVEHQLAILEAGPSYFRSPDAVEGFSSQAADLRAVLNEIDENLAALPAEDA